MPELGSVPSRDSLPGAVVDFVNVSGVVKVSGPPVSSTFAVDASGRTISPLE